MSDSMYPVAAAALSALVLGASMLMLYLRTKSKSSKAPAAASQTAVDGRQVVRIFFGTQTGTAEKFAKQLATKLADLYGESTRFECQDMEQYDHEAQLASESMMLFLMATYGDGEPTDNAQQFCQWLEQASEAVMNGDRPEVIKGVPYAVFALGNKQYEHFNAVGKLVHKHLAVLGGDAITGLGLGDDDVDIADDFATWTGALLAALEARELLVRSAETRDTTHACKAGYTVRVLDAVARAGSLAEPWAGLAAAGSQAAQLVTVAAVRELHAPASDRSCVHVELNLSGTGLAYEHGDHLAVFAQNDAATVAEACAALGCAPDAVIELAVPPGNAEMLSPPFPCPTTVASALAHHCELLQHPDKACLAALAACATAAGDAERLRHLAAHDGRADYAAYIVQSKRSLLEVLRDFPSAKPSLGVFFAHIAPRLQPRYYSIASSPLEHPCQAHVTAAVVDEVTPTGRRHRGVATTHLARCRPGDRLPVFVRQSTFKLPADAGAPVVMVGPGTGVAPFRGFLQHRHRQARAGAELGPAMLFFGCRHPEKDYIYQDELQGHLEAGVLAHLSTAFSRLCADKDYVQHHVARHARAIADALDRGGSFYVCGDAKHMAKDVHRALHDAVAAARGCSASEAEAYVRALQKGGRYMQDVW